MASRTEAPSYKPALLVVDVQEDFCPPSGTLAVAGGREIAGVINQLLDLPFVLKVATRDFHPENHISFDTSHYPPKTPFKCSVKIKNPANEQEETEVPIWPAHCIQGTKGSEIIPELHVTKLDHIVEKGKDKRLEMFSGFADVFGNKSSAAASHDLANLLKSKGVTHVYTVGIAGDYCVRATALDAKKEGFEVFVVDEATRSVDPGEKGWEAAKKHLDEKGIKVISIDGIEIQKIKNLA